MELLRIVGSTILNFLIGGILLFIIMYYTDNLGIAFPISIGFILVYAYTSTKLRRKRYIRLGKIDDKKK